MFLGRGGRERGCYCLVLSNGIDIEMEIIGNDYC